ncbi:MAG TPA: hypothetical protein VN478_02770, partial [Clostridia bacterium]|nr:hypothetical protein [Clostridia bacterium]
MKNLTRLSDLRRRFTIALLLAYVGVAIGLAVVVPHQLHSAETRWRSTLSSTAADRAGILDT